MSKRGSVRGSVKVFQPTWTEKLPDGTKRSRKGKSWGWRFTFRGQKYQECGDKRTGLPFTKDTEALAAGEARKAQVVAGYTTDPYRYTFSALEQLITAKASNARSKLTKASARGVVGRLKTYFRSDELVIEIGQARLLGYKPFREDAPYHAQASTIKLDLSYLRRAMTAAYKEGKMLRVPEFPKIDVAPRTERFRPDEFERLMACLPDWWKSFFVILEEVGWRESELRSRKRTDVNWEEGHIYLDAAHAKGGKKERTFPMTEYLAALLHDQIAYVQRVEEATGTIIPWLFCQPNGRPLGRPKDAWRRACAKAGFGKLEGRRGPWSGAKVAHDIRRTTLRKWDRLGLPLGGRMAAAGHDSRSSHEGYLGDDPETMKAFAERLDEDRRRRAGEAAKVVPMPIKKAGGEP